MHDARLEPLRRAWLLLVAFALTFCLAAGCDDTTDGEPGDDDADVSMGDTTETRDDTSVEEDGEDTAFPDQIIVDTEQDTTTGQDTRETGNDTITADTNVEIDVSTDALLLTDVFPASGPSQGQNVVTLTGEGFTPDIDVFFGAGKAPAVSYNDATEIEVVVPGGDAGVVDVKVVNANGNSTLTGAYTYVDAITIEAIDPTRSPTTGGVPFELTGSGFEGDISVSIGGRSAIEVAVVSDTLISGLTPPGVAGPADVRVTSQAGSALAEDLIELYVPLAVDQIFPAAGPTTGGTTVRLTGAGFDDSIPTVRFGNKIAPIVSRTATTLTVTAPAQVAGPRNVVVSSDNGTVQIDDGYTYVDPTDTALTLAGIQPSSGPVTGGNEVVIAGNNLDGANLAVTLGGTPVTSILETTPTSIRAVAPAGTVGLADVTVSRAGDSATATGIYEYLPALELDTVDPAEGPVVGGTLVTLTGAGFDTDTTVRFGPLPATDITVTSPTTLTAVTPAGPGGAVDVVVRRGSQRATLIDGFVYTDTLGVFGIVPRRGSQAGNTRVTIAGKGFAPGAMVTFDGTPAPIVDVLDASTIEVRTPPHEPDIVQVEVELNGETAVSPNVFTYYDPTAQFGGGWGDPIAGTINVTVLESGGGAPVDAAFVMLSTDTGTPYQGLTDVNGQITFSGDDVFGSQTLSASKDGYSSATVETIDAENVTVFLNSLEPPEGNPPPSVEPAFIEGTVTGAEKVALLNDPNKIRLSVVVTSQVGPFTNNPDPGPQNQVNGGNGYYRLQSRLGTVAVIAMCGLYDTVSGQFDARYLAMQRFIDAVDGTTQTVDLNCTIKLDQVMTFKLVDSPLDEDPDVNLVLPFLNIGPEGVFGGYSYALGTTDTIVTPNQAPLTGPLANMSYYVIGGAWTGGGSPYSLAHRDGVTDFSQTLEFGPLLGLPQLVSPLPGGAVTDGFVEWTLDNPERVDMIVVNIVEPGFPVDTPIWDIYLPGSATGFDLPEFLAGSGAAAAFHGAAEIQFDLLKSKTSFDFDTFSLNDLALNARERFVFKAVPVFFP